MKRLIGSTLSLLVLILGSGCTVALWKSSDLEAWNQPANDPHLRLFESKSQADILVVYDEYAERRESSRTRAYWLNENQKLIANSHAPHFVSTNSVFCLTAVPVFTSPPGEAKVPYALLGKNGQSFTIFSPPADPATHDLPYYNDRKGKVEKFLLTPAAVTVDATILGAILGYAYAESATSGYNPSY